MAESPPREAPFPKAPQIYLSKLIPRILWPMLVNLFDQAFMLSMANNYRPIISSRSLRKWLKNYAGLQLPYQNRCPQESPMCLPRGLTLVIARQTTSTRSPASLSSLRSSHCVKGRQITSHITKSNYRRSFGTSNMSGGKKAISNSSAIRGRMSSVFVEASPIKLRVAKQARESRAFSRRIMT